MRTQLAGRRGPSSPGYRLVLTLALALCACGGGDDGGAGKTGDTTASQSDAGTAATAAAGDTCTTPPPSYTTNLLTGPWSALVARLASDGVTFPAAGGNDLTGQIRLCPDCEKVEVRINSSHLTHCLAPEHLTGEPRIVSLITLRADFAAQHGWGALTTSDSIFIFASATEGSAVLVYDSAGTAKMAPSGAMQFKYCQDGHTSPRPQVRWHVRPASNEQEKGKGKGLDEVEDCVNQSCKTGCCIICCCSDDMSCPGG